MVTLRGAEGLIIYDGDDSFRIDGLVSPLTHVVVEIQFELA